MTLVRDLLHDAPADHIELKNLALFTWTCKFGVAPNSPILYVSAPVGA
ncbi:hypothetical protein SAMN06295905_0759 [Devosia lucknowensis]|uniref:Uncharacterized protein n=1 Tax=Devosia lucknowensis TaxID=1096929 RepID=A0A1Y6EQ17_9HYPH|nr:hypothetical protein SAMN06295905_0759 [Devosia lucknowensis]